MMQRVAISVAASFDTFGASLETFLLKNGEQIARVDSLRKRYFKCCIV